MITTEDCGLAVPPGDASAFADALERAADNRDTLKAMGRRARGLAERDFDRARLADLWLHTLESAAPDGSAALRSHESTRAE